MIRQYELIERVKLYDPHADEDSINRAYVFSMKAHGGQTRASGDPYFSHPLEVAWILAQMRLDTATIVTGLLHDTVEDTLTTFEEIEKLFGADVSFLVRGVTKLSKIEWKSERVKQAENFLKLVLAMAQDIRVHLVKLADRLHNMRTLHYIKTPEKRQRISTETLEIYAPLAERIGMGSLKDELEELAFKELQPDLYHPILEKLEEARQQSGISIKETIKELTSLLEAHHIKCSIFGRIKTPYSIMRKMHNKNMDFEQLSDIIAFRVVVESVAQCYQVLGIFHNAYIVLPGRFKDYISTPKANRYQSLHTSIMGPFQRPIEIQIRTPEMDDIATYGVAAHWRYKGGGERQDYQWLRSLLEIIENASGPEDFLENTKLEMFQDEVFCLTPKGDPIALPLGATAIDFAYAVHSYVGDHCAGVKINGRLMPVRTKLNTGDIVEVITQKHQNPSPTWERFVVTGKARSCIRRFIRTQQHAEYLKLGKTLLQKELSQQNLPCQEKILKETLPHFKCNTLEDLYVLIGQGLRTAQDVLRVACPTHTLQPSSEHKVLLLHAAGKKQDQHAVSIIGLIPGMAVHYAACCHPLPGDFITGVITTGKGITIHTDECETLAHVLEKEPERQIDISWNREVETDQKFVGRVSVTMFNKPGSLAAISSIIGRYEANIVNLKITHRAMEFFDSLIDLEVTNTEHLYKIIAALKITHAVHSVERL